MGLGWVAPDDGIVRRGANMRAVIIEREGAWQVRTGLGNKLPVRFDDTELKLVTHNEKSAVEACASWDDFNDVTYVFLDGE